LIPAPYISLARSAPKTKWKRTLTLFPELFLFLLNWPFKARWAAIAELQTNFAEGRKVLRVSFFFCSAGAALEASTAGAVGAATALMVGKLRPAGVFFFWVTSI